MKSCEFTAMGVGYVLEKSKMKKTKNNNFTNNIKVLFLPSHYVFDEIGRGSEQYVSFYVTDSLAKRFPKSVVVTGRKNISGPRSYRIVEIQKNKKIHEGFLAKNAIPFSIKYSIVGGALLMKEKFDLVHHVRPFKMGATFNLPVLLGLNRGTPFIIGSFCSSYSKEYADLQSREGIDNLIWMLIERIISPLIRLLSIATLKKADKVIVYNEYTFQQVNKYVKKEKISIIPSGIDRRRYSPGKKTGSTFELISVGYLIPRKGFDLLIKSFSDVVKKHQNVVLRIIGDGPERKNIKKTIKKYGLGNNVILTGFVPNEKINKYYQKAQIFVSMQKEESYGQVYLESLASGLPIITTNNIGSRGIIKSSFGYLIEQNDLKSFSNKINYLVEHPDIIKKMSKNARKEFEKKYDWEKIIIPKYLKIYNEVLG